MTKILSLLVYDSDFHYREVECEDMDMSKRTYYPSGQRDKKTHQTTPEHRDSSPRYQNGNERCHSHDLEDYTPEVFLSSGVRIRSLVFEGFLNRNENWGDLQSLDPRLSIDHKPRQWRQSLKAYETLGSTLTIMRILFWFPCCSWSWSWSWRLLSRSGSHISPNLNFLRLHGFRQSDFWSFEFLFWWHLENKLGWEMGFGDCDGWRSPWHGDVNQSFVCMVGGWCWCCCCCCCCDGVLYVKVMNRKAGQRTMAATPLYIRFYRRTECRQLRIQTGRMINYSNDSLSLSSKYSILFHEWGRPHRDWIAE